MIRDKGLSRRHFVALVAGASVIGPLAGVAHCGGRRPVVVELFTSQGCSSCPEADAVLGELARRKGVLALSLNVDYWDYLGWRDTLASADHTKRQRDYAQRRGDGQVYTPQMVIDGKRHIVGSKRSEVIAAIEAEAAGAESVGVSMSEQDGEVVIDVAAAPSGKLKQDSTVWVMLVAPKIGVAVERGENTGKSIDYYNVVRKVMPAGMWHGEAISLRLPKADLFVDGATACAALLQVGGSGPIIGAAWMPGPES